MSRPKSLPMPTEKQIEQILSVAAKFRPGAFVESVGPNGIVKIGYLGDIQAQDAADFSAKPFSAAA